MAVEISLKVSLLAGRAGVAHSRNRFCSREKLQLPNATGPSKLSSLSVSPSSNRSSRIICKAREAVDGVQVVTDTNWSDLVIASENPVLVEFWAPWCGPCRMIAPVVDELAREYTGKIACFKLNTDDCPSIATQYGIRSIPTVLFFKNGERKESIIGAVPKSTLTATIEKYLEV